MGKSSTAGGPTSDPVKNLIGEAFQSEAGLSGSESGGRTIPEIGELHDFPAC
jgi:hypothetical protein